MIGSSDVRITSLLSINQKFGEMLNDDQLSPEVVACTECPLALQIAYYAQLHTFIYCMIIQAQQQLPEISSC